MHSYFNRKVPLAWRHTPRWEVNIKMDLKTGVWGCELVSVGSG